MNKYATISTLVYKKFISNIICRILTKSEKFEKYLNNYYSSSFLIQILEKVKDYEEVKGTKINTTRAIGTNVKCLYNKFYKFEKVEVFEILKKYYIIQNQRK